MFFLALLRVLRDLRTELTNSSVWTSKSLPQSIDITNMRWMSDTLPHQYTARLKSKLYRVNRSLIYIIATSLLFWAEGSILHHRHHQQQQQQQLHKILLQYFVALVWKIYFIFCWGIFCFSDFQILMQSCIVGRPPVERSHKAHIFHCIINHDENLTLKVYFSCRLFCGLLEISQMIALEYLSKGNSNVHKFAVLYIRICRHTLLIGCKYLAFESLHYFTVQPITEIFHKLWVDTLTKCTL